MRIGLREVVESTWKSLNSPPPKLWPLCCCWHDKLVRHCLYGGEGQMPWRDEEFHQVVTVLEHILFVDYQSNVAVLLPILGKKEANVSSLFSLYFHNVQHVTTATHTAGIHSTSSSPEPTLTSLLAVSCRTVRSFVLRFVCGDRLTHRNQSVVEPGMDMRKMCLHVTWLLHSCAQTLSSSAISRRTTLLYCTVTWWCNCLTSTVLWSWCVAGWVQLCHGSTPSAAMLVVKPEQPRDSLGANVLIWTSDLGGQAEGHAWILWSQT